MLNGAIVPCRPYLPYVTQGWNRAGEEGRSRMLCMRLRAGATSILSGRPTTTRTWRRAMLVSWECYDMRCWAITKALVVLVPGLPDDVDDGLRIRCPIYFPGGSAGEASELASLGPTAVTHPSNGVSWHCLARAGRKGSTCLGQQVVAQQPPRFARGCPSTVGREGPPKMKRDACRGQSEPSARFALVDINRRSGTVLAQVPNKQLGRTSGGI